MQHPVLLFALFAFLMSSCAENPPEAAKCKYQVHEHTTPRLATYAHDLNIPFDQEKLVQFMNVDLPQSECFAKQYAAVKIYRIPYAQDSGYLKPLASAPQKAIETWNNFSAETGFNLKGLTIFRYQPGKEEKILEAQILLRTDATSWHLWHEFSHFIIGTARAKSHEHSLHIAEKSQLDQLKSDLLSASISADTLSDKLQKYFNDNYEYIQKRFVDEIVIEASILHITSQTPLDVATEDIQHSHAFIQTYAFDMNLHILDAQNTLQQIQQIYNLSNAQKDQLRMYSERLTEQLQKTDRVVINSTALGRIPFFD